MVGGSVPCRVNSARPRGILVCQLATVPILDAFPPRPRGCGWMFDVGFPPTLLAGENCSHPRCVNNPARTNCSGAVTVAKCYRLFFSGPQLRIDYRCRTQNLRASNTGAAQHLFIKRGTIQLIRRHPHLIERAELACFSQCFYFVVCKPKP